MSSADTIRALDHPYRRSILRILDGTRITYSDLFRRLEPNGGERARFNYHLRALRSADLVRLTDSLYGLTPRGEAALLLVRGVSERSEARPPPKRESRAGERGWVRKVGHALSSRAAEVKAIVPVWRVLLLVGSVFLLVGLTLPWLTATGYDYGTYSGIALTGQLVSHLGTPVFEPLLGPYSLVVAFAWLGWLILVAVLGVTSSLVTRTFSWFAISGIILLALDALLIHVAPDRLHFGSFGFEYGFFVALLGSASIVAGARLKTPAGTIAPMRTRRPLGILLVGLGLPSMVGGLFALPPGPHGLPSPIPGILLIGVGIVSTVGGLFALKSSTMAPPSPGITLMVLGTVSAVGGFLGFLYGPLPFGPAPPSPQERWPIDLTMVSIFFGVTMFVVGLVLRVRPSIGSRPARPAVSHLREEDSGSGGRRQRQGQHRDSRRRASVPFPPLAAAMEDSSDGPFGS